MDEVLEAEPGAEVADNEAEGCVCGCALLLLRCV